MIKFLFYDLPYLVAASEDLMVEDEMHVCEDERV
jgi:hypothetical protein